MMPEQGIQPQLDKIIVITNIAEPKNVGDLHHFLRLTGYYRKVIPLYTDITKPCNKLLRKDTKFQWSIPCHSAFKPLKNALCKNPILKYPDIDQLYTLFIDASNYAYSGIFTQVVEGSL